MAEKFLRDEYETPRMDVRGVFLCESVADTAVSVLTVGITQEAWGADVVMGEASTDTDGDVWLGY
jgi:hypothetical protein